MIKYIFSFTFILFVLCGCSNQMPFDGFETKSTILPARRNPYSSPSTLPATKSKLQANVPSSIIMSTSESHPYNIIIDCYRGFINRDEAADIDTELNNLWNNIAIELNLSVERKKYELWCSCVEIRNSKLNYAIHDINCDDIPELLILSENYFIHAIYSLQDSSPILVGGYWSRNSCVVDKAGVLYINSSSGAADNYSSSYSLTSGDELQLIEMVGIESHGESSDGLPPPAQCYWIQDGTKTIVNYEESLTIRDKFPNTYLNNPTENIGLIVVPLAN